MTTFHMRQRRGDSCRSERHAALDVSYPPEVENSEPSYRDTAPGYYVPRLYERGTPWRYWLLIAAGLAILAVLGARL